MWPIYIYMYIHMFIIFPVLKIWNQHCLTIKMSFKGFFRASILDSSFQSVDGKTFGTPVDGSEIRRSLTSCWGKGSSSLFLQGFRTILNRWIAGFLFHQQHHQTSIGAGLMATAGLVAAAAGKARRAARRSRKAGAAMVVGNELESQCLGMGDFFKVLFKGEDLLDILPVKKQFRNLKMEAGLCPKRKLDIYIYMYIYIYIFTFIYIYSLPTILFQGVC